MIWNKETTKNTKPRSKTRIYREYNELTAHLTTTKYLKRDDVEIGLYLATPYPTLSISLSQFESSERRARDSIRNLQFS